MKIRVPKSQLLRQLPDMMRAQLVSCNDLPDYFDFEFFGASPADEKKDRSLKGEYSAVVKVLTPMQWFMFCVLIRNPEGAAISALAGKLRNAEFNMANNVSVHIKGMRQAFKKHLLPFEVVNIRGSVLGAGSYKIIKK